MDEEILESGITESSSVFGCHCENSFPDTHNNMQCSRNSSIPLILNYYLLLFIFNKPKQDLKYKNTIKQCEKGFSFIPKKIHRIPRNFFHHKIRWNSIE